MPGQEHGDAFGDVRADQVAGGGAPAIVEEAGRYLGRLAGGAPGGAPAADRDPIAVEDERAVGVAACPPSRQRLGDGGRDGENASHQRLRAPGREPDDAAGPIDLVPGEAEDLVLAPPGVVGEVEDILLKPGGRLITVIDDSVLSGKTYAPVRAFIREKFVVRGIISLHGDAFQRSGARAKTSVLYLTKRPSGDLSQPSVFVYESRYIGLDDVTTKTRPTRPKLANWRRTR